MLNSCCKANPEQVSVSSQKFFFLASDRFRVLNSRTWVHNDLQWNKTKGIREESHFKMVSMSRISA